MSETEEPENNTLSIEMALQKHLPETLDQAAKELEKRADQAARKYLVAPSPEYQTRALLLRGWCDAVQTLAHEFDAILTAHEMGDETQLRRISTDAERLIQQAERSVQQLLER